MVLAIPSLNRVQIGREATKGTLVPATRLLYGRANVREIQELYRGEYNRGYRANVGGAGNTAFKAVEIDFESDLVPGQVLWPFLTGIRGNITPTGAGADKTWLFTPELTTAIPTIDSATVKFVDSDGVTNHYYAEAGYSMTRRIVIEWAFNQPAKLRHTMFARARQTGAPDAVSLYTTATTPYMSNKLAVYLDSTWAGLGGTQLTNLMRGVTIEIDTGLEGDFTMDSRPDADFTTHLVGKLTAKLSLLMEMDATASARMTEFRNNGLVFIRLKQLGAALGGSNYSVQLDGCYRFTDSPERSEDEKRVLRTFNLETVLDETSLNTFLPTIVDALTGVGSL